LEEPEAESLDPEQDNAQGERRAASVDINKLAEKVYRLMLAEARLERKRGVRSDGR
jgi:hypothetical protein